MNQVVEGLENALCDHASLRFRLEMVHTAVLYGIPSYWSRLVFPSCLTFLVHFYQVWVLASKFIAKSVAVFNMLLLLDYIGRCFFYLMIYSHSLLDSSFFDSYQIVNEKVNYEAFC